MDPAIALAATVLAASMGLAAVTFRRGPSELHRTLLCTLAVLGLWTLAISLRELAPSPQIRSVALHVTFVVGLGFPAVWVLLIWTLTRGVRVGVRADRIGLVMLPSLLTYVAWLTDDLHHGFIRATARDMAGPLGRLGPVGVAFVAWAGVCLSMAAGWLLQAGRKLASEGELRRAAGLFVAAVLPIAAVGLWMLGLVPRAYPVVPTGAVVALLVLTTTAMRYQLLESLPLAHRDVVGRLHEGVVVADRHGGVIDCNAAAQSMLPNEVVFGSSLAGVVASMAADDERDAVHGELERLDGPAVRVDYSFTTLDDRRVDLRATILRGGDGEPAAGRLAVLRDRTEELRYGEILRRTQTLETVGTLAAGVAHEVNNPLAFVRANLTELARMGERVQALSGQPGAKLAADLSDLHDVAVEALEGIQRIERVVSDMRRLSAAQTDGAATVDMHEVVRDAVRLARLRRGPDVPLSVSLSNERPVVYGSSQLLVQCVLNLLVNALEAVEPLPQPEIRVESIVTPDAVSVCVSDNGPGVSEAMRERIFSPFVTSREGSRGLGLTIARDVASDHGGSLRCEQPQGPMGACFVLRVPVESACI